jgi:hypothetical protein
MIKILETLNGIKMKKPKLKWIPVFIVENWGEEIVEGVGTYLENFVDGFVQYNGVWIVEINGLLHRKSGINVYDDKKFAEERLKYEKKKYLEFCKEEVLKYQEKVKKLSLPEILVDGWKLSSK